MFGMGLGLCAKQLKGKRIPAGEKEQLPHLRKGVFLMRQNLGFTHYGAESKGKEVFKLAINSQSFRKAGIWEHFGGSDLTPRAP